MKGSPAKMGGIAGTAGHRSAIKARQSALKESEEKEVYIKPGGEMKHKMKDLPMNSKERYEEYQRRGWGMDATISDYAKSLENKKTEEKKEEVVEKKPSNTLKELALDENKDGTWVGRTLKKIFKKKDKKKETTENDGGGEEENMIQKQRRKDKERQKIFGK